MQSLSIRRLDVAAAVACGKEVGTRIVPGVTLYNLYNLDVQGVGLVNHDANPNVSSLP